MKYIDPKTGKEYDSLEQAKTEMCWQKIKNRCRSCPLSHENNGTIFGCRFFLKLHPAEAVKAMGLEVISENGGTENANM